MRVTISQSNYIPWKGYFDLIDSVDVFIFYDVVQFTKNDWRNRNRIKTAQGTTWLTVPVGQAIDRAICEVEIKDHRWQKKHLRTLRQSYARAPHIKAHDALLEEIYTAQNWTSLSALNQSSTQAIARHLGIKTQFLRAQDFNPEGDRIERLQHLLREVGATHYSSAPAARSYLGDDPTEVLGTSTDYFSYPEYPEYTQPHGEFEHAVTVLDTLFCTGEAAAEHILRSRRGAPMKP